MKKSLVFFALISALFCLDKSIEMDIAKRHQVKSLKEIRDASVIKQKYDYSCGSASIATILTYYYGVETSEEEVLMALGREKEASEDEKKQARLSFLDISKYAESRGFRGMGLSLDFDGFKKIKVPVIVFIKLGKLEHFSVYRGMDEDFVYLADPSVGNRKIGLSKFKEMFEQYGELAKSDGGSSDDAKDPKSGGVGKQKGGAVLVLIPNNSNHEINKSFMKN